MYTSDVSCATHCSRAERRAAQCSTARDEFHRCESRSRISKTTATSSPSNLPRRNTQHASPSTHVQQNITASTKTQAMEQQSLTNNRMDEGSFKCVAYVLECFEGCRVPEPTVVSSVLPMVLQLLASLCSKCCGMGGGIGGMRCVSRCVHHFFLWLLFFTGQHATILTCFKHLQRFGSMLQGLAWPWCNTSRYVHEMCVQCCYSGVFLLSVCGMSVFSLHGVPPYCEEECKLTFLVQ